MAAATTNGGEKAALLVHAVAGDTCDEAGYLVRILLESALRTKLM